MHLLIDLDGTLTDSRPGIFNCIRHAFSEYDLEVPDEKDLLWCIGPPIQESLGKLIGPDSQDLLEPVLSRYRERYGSVGLFENSVYPEIEDALAEAVRQGHSLHVATSKVGVYAKRIITHFGLDQHFTSVTGSEFDGTLADKSELIAHILEREAIDPAQAVMIGDRKHDMIGARKNGVTAIGVLWGYGTGRELMESGANLCARKPHLLAELIASLH